MKAKSTAALLAMLLLLTACTDNTSVVSESSVAESTTTASTTAPETEEPAQEEPPVVEEQEESLAPDIASNDSMVRFSAESGVYGEKFSLDITADKCTLYYTTDGSDPRTSSTRKEYTAPLEIADRSGDKNVVSAVDPLEIAGSFNKYSRKDEAFRSELPVPDDDAVDKITVIRAASLAEDDTWSAVFTNSYFVGAPSDHIEGIEESVSAEGNDLAVISITMNYEDLFDSERGIYVKGDIFDKSFEEYLATGERIDGETARSLDANYKQRGKEWERFCHIDFFEMNGDGAQLALSQDCGIRIQGNYSRSDIQKGLRLYARSDYGDNKFRYSVFGEELTDIEGKTIDSFKTLVLRAGGNCALTSKFNDTYWQEASKSLDCATKASRPCVVYLNGEYWGVYVLEEDYSDNFFEDHYGVNNKDVVVYKGDAESLELGYKLDEGDLPEGVTDESYYFADLLDFFATHTSLESQQDYDEFAQLVDVESVRDYFLAQVWINNKWDWPGKNWSMWRTIETDEEKEYADGRWRFMFYDMEFGGVGGEGDARVNTVKEDNYKPLGLLDFDTDNPAVLCYAYLMTNEGFRTDYNARLNAMGEGIFAQDTLTALLDSYVAEYEPLFDQFFERYPETGDTEGAIHGGYASADCIRWFVAKRGGYISRITDWIDKQFE